MSRLASDNRLPVTAASTDAIPIDIAQGGDETSGRSTMPTWKT